MKLPVAVLMVAISVGLAGCFSSNPSESDAKEAVYNSYKEFIDSGNLVVEHVKKTDGKEMEAMGVKLYEMTVELTLKLPKGRACEKKRNEVELLSIMTILCYVNGDQPIAPGTSTTRTARVVFEKSEKGWSGRVR